MNAKEIAEMWIVGEGVPDHPAYVLAQAYLTLLEKHNKLHRLYGMSDDDIEAKIEGLVEATEKLMEWEFPRHLRSIYDGMLEDWQEVQTALTAYKEGK